MGEMEYTVDLPEKWHRKGELHIKRERPDNPMGTPVVLRAVESVSDDTDSSLSNRFYIIKEVANVSNEIVDSAQSKDEAKRKLIDAARDHW